VKFVYLACGGEEISGRQSAPGSLHLLFLLPRTKIPREERPGLSLESLLAQKRASILKRWFDLVVETYPAETSRFLQNKKDRFTNPVGFAIKQGLEGILTELLKGFEPDKLSPFLDRIIRVRAVQDFAASQAVAFIFGLKQIVRQELEEGLGEADELASLDARIDALALIAFDVYMSCREQIYKMKADEIRRLTYNLLRRAKMICETEEEPCVDPTSTA